MHLMMQSRACKEVRKVKRRVLLVIFFFLPKKNKRIKTRNEMIVFTERVASLINMLLMKEKKMYEDVLHDFSAL